MLAKIVEQRGKDVFQLRAEVATARRRLAQNAVAFVVRLVDERLKQAGLVLEMIIKRGLGNLRVVHDVLDGRGRIAGVREAF